MIFPKHNGTALNLFSYLCKQIQSLKFKYGYENSGKHFRG